MPWGSLGLQVTPTPVYFGYPGGPPRTSTPPGTWGILSPPAPRACQACCRVLGGQWVLAAGQEPLPELRGACAMPCHVSTGARTCTVSPVSAGKSCRGRGQGWQRCHPRLPGRTGGISWGSLHRSPIPRLAASPALSRGLRVPCPHLLPSPGRGAQGSVHPILIPCPSWGTPCTLAPALSPPCAWRGPGCGWKTPSLLSPVPQLLLPPTLCAVGFWVVVVKGGCAWSVLRLCPGVTDDAATPPQCRGVRGHGSVWTLPPWGAPRPLPSQGQQVWGSRGGLTFAWGSSRAGHPRYFQH